MAASNTKRLNQTLYITLAVHGLWWLLRALIFRASLSRKSLLVYVLLSAPQLLIELYFERLSRPTLTADGGVQRAGEDLDAKGLTEYMWDVVYWTYGCITMSAILGDYAWWLWAVIPAYSGYAAWGMYTGMRGGYQDAAGVPQPQASGRPRWRSVVDRRCNTVEELGSLGMYYTSLHIKLHYASTRVGILGMPRLRSWCGTPYRHPAAAAPLPSLPAASTLTSLKTKSHLR